MKTSSEKEKKLSLALSKLKNLNPNIEYLSVGGEHLKALEIKSIYDLKEITYLGFTKVILNIFKIKKKINETVDKIIEFNINTLSIADVDHIMKGPYLIDTLSSETEDVDFIFFLFISLFLLLVLIIIKLYFLKKDQLCLSILKGY